MPAGRAKIALSDGFLATSFATLLYLNTLPNGFVFDDHRAVERNPSVTNSASLLDRDFWGTPLSSPSSHGSYRPLAVLSLRLSRLLDPGGSARGFHAVNALLHGASAAALWLVARLRLRRADALAAALCFAAHPLNTEAVAYCVGRADLLAAALGLLALACHQARGGGAMTAFVRHSAACACFAAALACKETAIVLILACAAWELLAPRSPRSTIAAALRCTPPALVGAGYLLLRAARVGSWTHTFRVLDNPIAFAASARARWLSTARVHGTCAALLLWPATLSADYSLDALPIVDDWRDPALAPAALLYAAAAALVVLLGRRGRSAAAAESRRARAALAWVVTGALAFAPAAHVPTPLAFVVAERLLYVPCAAACVVVAGFGLGELRRRGRGGRLCARLLLCAILVAAGGRTMRRNCDWRSDATLFGAALAAYPRSAKAAYQLADGAIQRGDRAAAEPLLRRALEIHPTYHYAYLHLARLALLDGAPQAAADAAAASLAAVPAPNPHAHLLAARALLRLGRAADAEPHARRAASDLGAADATAHDTLAEALAASTRWPEAAAAFAAAAATEGSAERLDNLGAALLRAGRRGEARDAFERALVLNPGDERARRGAAEARR